MTGYFPFSTSPLLSQLNILSRSTIFPRKTHTFQSTPDLSEKLSASQPRSIVDVNSKSIQSFDLNLYVYKIVIICPCFFQLFITPYLVQQYSFYPADDVECDWQSLFPSAHQFPAQLRNQLYSPDYSSDIFTGLKVIYNSHRFSFCIKYHPDADNYWHWTFDWLPRLLVLRRALDGNSFPFQIEQVDFYSYSVLNSFQKSWFFSIFPEVSRVIELSTPVQFYNHISVNHSFTAHHNAEYISEIRAYQLVDHQFTHSESLPASNTSRIFILRGKSLNGRNIANQDEITSILKCMGFVFMSMDSYSVPQQASI